LTPSDPHLDYLRAALDDARAAPLSGRKVRLVAMLADAYADRLFAGASGDRDVRVFRRELASRSAALAAVFAVANDRARIVIDTIEVPITDYTTLPLADFMVSLYNAHTVQRVRISLPDGTHLPAHDVLTEAIAILEKQRASQGETPDSQGRRSTTERSG